MNQSPTVVCFIEVLPPQFDSEILEVEESGGRKRERGSVVEERGMSISEAVERYNEMKLITVGC